MIIAVILSVAIPALLLTVLPRVVAGYGINSRKYLPWLWAACGAYVISWWLPSPYIEGRDTAFITHFIGGGIFSGLVWVYLKRSFGWSTHWLIEIISLFALVSVLGVANELFEVVLYIFGKMPYGISDTSWDLLANTLGVVLFYVVYKILTKGR